MYLIFAIILYIFKVYINVNINNDEKMLIALLLASIYSFLIFILNINNNYVYNHLSIMDRNALSIIYVSICLGLSSFVPTFIIILLSVFIFKETTIYFGVYKYIRLSAF
jgi:hypothetical protein